MLFSLKAKLFSFIRHFTILMLLAGSSKTQKWAQRPAQLTNISGAVIGKICKNTQEARRGQKTFWQDVHWSLTGDENKAPPWQVILQGLSVVYAPKNLVTNPHRRETAALVCIAGVGLPLSQTSWAFSCTSCEFA